MENIKPSLFDSIIFDLDGSCGILVKPAPWPGTQPYNHPATKRII